MEKNKNVDVLEVLRKAAEAERKRRKTAIECLEKLTEQLTESFLPLLGDRFDGDGYNAVEEIGWNLYFRYAPHHGAEEVEREGFYFDPSQHLVWGKELSSLRGRVFWRQIRRILAWADNLPAKIREIEEERKSNIARLEKIVAAIATIEE